MGCLNVNILFCGPFRTTVLYTSNSFHNRRVIWCIEYQITFFLLCEEEKKTTFFSFENRILRIFSIQDRLLRQKKLLDFYPIVKVSSLSDNLSLSSDNLRSQKAACQSIEKSCWVSAVARLVK